MSRILLIVVLAATGCLDTQLDDVEFDLPERAFTVDTAQWGLSADETLPEVPCGEVVGVCSLGLRQACGSELCFGSCDGTFCRATVLVSLYHSVDILTEVPELENFADQDAVDILIKSISYDISGNTLTMQTPDLSFYVASSTTQSPGDPRAKLVGTLPGIAPGATVTQADLPLEDEGIAELERFMGHLRTPFNLIIGAQVDLEAGMAMPSGRLEAVVRIRAAASVL